MKTLVVYYSRTGVTSQVAQALARRLGADMEEVREIKGRQGVLGYVKALADGGRKLSSAIMPLTHDPAEYDLVVVATPVWAFTMACAVRTYLTECGRNIKRLGLMCTMESSGDKGAFRDMESLCGRQAEARLTVLSREVRQDTFRPKIDSFAESLKA